MSNIADKDWLKTGALNKSVNLNAMRRTECFPERNARLEKTTIGTSTTQQNGFNGVLPRSSTINTFKLKEMNQLFKVPNFDNLPVKKATVKSIISPRRVRTGRLKSDIKSNQQSKISFLPRPSFINTRKSLHCSRSTQVNARKELIKKMVFLAECALKENQEIKQSTPVKVLAGLTPRKTPRSRGYLVLPEFNKKVANVEDLRSPIQDFIRKEAFAYSAKSPLAELKNEKTCFNPSEENKANITLELKQDLKTEMEAPESSARFSQILCHCRIYNTEANLIYEKLKSLDDCFENNLNDVPDYRIYNEFCDYQSRKVELYSELQRLEEELKNFVATHTNIGNKLKDYIMRKREIFEKQNKLHKDFEQVVSGALEKCEERREEKEDAKEEKKTKVETPKLRRSLRLSKIAKKGKFEERTPMTRKLKKLDGKSKGIQKSAKVRSP